MRQNPLNRAGTGSRGPGGGQRRGDIVANVWSAKDAAGQPLKPSKVERKVRDTLRTCILLCRRCHGHLEEKKARKRPKRELAEFFETTPTVKCGFEVLVRSGPCSCSWCC